MATIEEVDRLLERFVQEEIALSSKDISNAVASREWFLERLRKQIESTNGPKLFAEEPFVKFGSYFSGLKVSDVDEFDILVVIDSNSGEFKSGGQLVGNGIGSEDPNLKYAPEFKKADGSGISPAKQLAWLQKLSLNILEPLGGAAPVKNGQAITVELKTQALKIDLVPAGIFEKIDDPTSIFYNIPKGDSGDGWIETNPKNDKALIEKLARDNLNFRNVIRIIKFIRDRYELKLSSYAIQCAVIYSLHFNKWGESFTINLLNALVYLAARAPSGEKILDLHDSKTDLLLGCDRSQMAATFMKIAQHISALDNSSYSEVTYKKLKAILSNTTPALSLADLFYTKSHS